MTLATPCLLVGTLSDLEGNISTTPISAFLSPKGASSLVYVLGETGQLLLTAQTVYTDGRGAFSLPLWPFLSLSPQTGYIITLPSFIFYAEIPTQETISLYNLLQLRTTIILGPRRPTH